MSERPKYAWGRIQEAPPEIAKLINAYLDGVISPDDFKKLSDWIRADKTHFRLFADVTLVHSSLQKVLHSADLRSFYDAADSSSDLLELVDPKNIRAMLDEAAAVEERAALEAAKAAAALEAEAEARRQAEASAARNRRPEPIEIPRSVAHLASVAVIIALVLAVQSQFQPNDGPATPGPDITVTKALPPEQTEPAIATIADSLLASWRDSEFPVTPNTPLSAGKFELKTGVVELAFPSGVQVIGEAPVNFELVSASRVLLSEGKLVAKVPEEAIGFSVVAASASVVDLGTEFGINVSNSGEVSVHVLDGEVALLPEKMPQEGPRETLAAGQARQVSADGTAVANLDFSKSEFLRKVPGSAYELAVLRSRPVLYYRFNELNSTKPLSNLGSADVSSATGANIAMGLLGERPEADNRVAIFSPEHQGIELSQVEALNLTNSFTIETWVRIPGSIDSNSPQRVLSSFSETNAGPLGKGGFAFGVAGASFAPKANLPPLVSLFTFYGKFDYVSQSELTPGQLTHMAVAVDGQGRPTMYVQGRKVPILVKQDGNSPDYRPPSADWEPGGGGSPATGPLCIGRNPVATGVSFPPERWNGEIDELALYDKVLDSEEINQHYQAGILRSERL